MSLAHNESSIELIETIALEEINSRLIRYADLKGLRNAFIDTRTPGSDAKENFTIIGPGVSENPEQHVHLPIPHGFNIGAARQPYGCVNSQHSHLTAEVFMVHSGEWLLHFGFEKQDGELAIYPGDVVSVPTNMFRGFSKVDSGTGMLFTVLGQDDPGRVTWAPQVFELAKSYGLKLLKGGKLIDTVKGESLPPDAELEAPPSQEDINCLKTPPLEKLLSCYYSEKTFAPSKSSKLNFPGVEEAGIINVQDTEDGFLAGPIKGWWEHGFCLRSLKLETGASIPYHARLEEEVFIIQSGALEIIWANGSTVLTAGDTLSVPIGLIKQIRNPSSSEAIAFVVRGTDNPKPPIFI